LTELFLTSLLVLASLLLQLALLLYLLFFVTDTTSPSIYTLSLHDALPIFRTQPLRRASDPGRRAHRVPGPQGTGRSRDGESHRRDRKSTRLNSSHVKISYAVFCLKKKRIYEFNIGITSLAA